MYHLLPRSLHRLACFIHFVLELVFPPLCFFMGPQLRFLGFLSVVALQIMILATGHYGFFNVCTITLGFTLLSDDHVPAWLMDYVYNSGSEAHVSILNVIWSPIVSLGSLVLFGAIVLASIMPMSSIGKSAVKLHPAIDVMVWKTFYDVSIPVLYRHLTRFSVVNSYGLFAVMTTSRREVTVWGSQDGRDWRQYCLSYAAADPIPWTVWPPLHLPRLDWRLWFCQFRPTAPPEWVDQLQLAILLGRSDVLDLFAVVPFAEERPKFVRFNLTDYQFASPAHLRQTGEFWVKKELGPFSSARSLQDFPEK